MIEEMSLGVEIHYPGIAIGQTEGLANPKLMFQGVVIVMVASLSGFLPGFS